VVQCGCRDDRVQTIVIDAFVVIIDGHREHFLGVLLTNHVLVQIRTDLIYSQTPDTATQVTLEVKIVYSC